MNPRHRSPAGKPDQIITFNLLPGTLAGEARFAITNFGTFGLTWATPIPLPEQTLVLGMGAG